MMKIIQKHLFPHLNEVSLNNTPKKKKLIEILELFYKDNSKYCSLERKCYHKQMRENMVSWHPI